MDCGNVLYISTVCVQEFIHLCQTGRLGHGKRRRDIIQPEEALQRIHEAHIGIVPVNEQHLQAYAELPIVDDHTDPSDRIIIAQAIADRVPLISSDHKFGGYADQGLHFFYNER